MLSQQMYEILGTKAISTELMFGFTAFKLQEWLCRHVVYSVPNSSSPGTKNGPQLKVNRALVHADPCIQRRNECCNSLFQQGLQLVKKQLVQWKLDVSTCAKPCVHTVQQL